MKLQEIEAMGVHWAAITDRNFDDTEIALLTRAVRQLRQALIDGEGKAIFAARAAVGLMDADVLELLEE